MPDMENLRDTVYPADWSGFPGETGARQQARDDLRLVDESYDHVLPADALAVNEVLRAEQAAAFEEADKSRIYNYEIEMQRPVPSIKRVAERVGWRQRAKRLMGKASEALREASITAVATAQAKVEQAQNYFSAKENNVRRRGVIGAVAGTLLVGAMVGAPSEPNHNKTETVRMAEAQSLAPNFNTPKVAENTRHVITVHSGENPWTISEQHLHDQGIANPTATQIANYDKKLARANPGKYTFGGPSSRYISAGTKLIEP